ncbi:hypothetical protein TNCV_977341 [Trichonephila clavipes]|nr:hypothetical protein TNCV_977341 [Trichonephila clavipes]
MVAIIRTQFGNKLKLRIKYFGPYQLTKVKLHDRYDVAKIGDHEGGRWERGNQRVNEREGIQRAEVDESGLKKERRERWLSRDTPPVLHERDA